MFLKLFDRALNDLERLLPSYSLILDRFTTDIDGLGQSKMKLTFSLLLMILVVQFGNVLIWVLLAEFIY